MSGKAYRYVKCRATKYCVPEENTVNTAKRKGSTQLVRGGLRIPITAWTCKVAKCCTTKCRISTYCSAMVTPLRTVSISLRYVYCTTNQRAAPTPRGAPSSLTWRTSLSTFPKKGVDRFLYYYWRQCQYYMSPLHSHYKVETKLECPAYIL